MDDKHWTSESIESMEFAVACDFISQLQSQMEEDGISQRDVAESLGKTEGYVSQLFNRPGNLTLKTMIAAASAVGLSVSAVAYKSRKHVGPVNSQLFADCWDAMGSPGDFFEFDDAAGPRYPLIADCAKCRDCKDPVHDWNAPDDLWAEVVGEEIVLCWDCFADRANRKGIWAKMHTIAPMPHQSSVPERKRQTDGE